jgi:hypothetical protein
MHSNDPAAIENLKKIWTDRHVSVKKGVRSDLTRFETMIGRVVTVNWSGRAVVDFGDGAWYDISQFEEVLTHVTDPDLTKSFDPTATSAQPKPTRQG